MARTIRWQMRFAARNEVIYTVSIYDEGWTGSITTLTAAANPFETQEDKNDNVFTPVRYSTGYLRFIVTDLSVLDDIMCKSVDGRYVTLTTTSGDLTTIRWQGYMQAQSFETEWESAPYEIEFPIVSSLGILEEKPYTPANSFLTLGYIMRRALTNSNNIIDFNTWHTPYRTSTHDLLSKINDHCFRNSDSEEWVKHLGYNADTVFPEESITCLEVITQICQYFGWTAYERGTHIYFVSVNGTTTYEWGYFSEINQGGSMTIRGTETAAAVVLPNVRSNDNNRKFLKGYGYFEIVEELDVPEDPINFDLTQVAPAEDIILEAKLTYAQYINYGNVLDSKNNIDATEDKTGDILSSSTANYYGSQLVRIKSGNGWMGIVWDSDERGDFDPGVILRRVNSAPSSDQRSVTFRSTIPLCGRKFPGGLALKGDVKIWNATDSVWESAPDNKTIRLQAEWNGKYLRYDPNLRTNAWNGTSSDSVSVRIDDGQLHGGFIEVQQGGGIVYRLLSPDDLFFIPTDNSCIGNLTLSLRPSQVDSDIIILITNMKLEAYEPNTVTVKSNIDYGKNLFRKTSNMGGFDVFSQTNTLCSGVDIHQSSDKMVLANDLTTALATIPEQDTVNRMAAMYGEPTEQIEVDVDGVSFTPYNPITVNSIDYFNASIETHWRDNKTKLQLQKLPTS